jgi:hypothetical protein
MDTPNDMEHWTARVRAILDEVGFERNRQEDAKAEGRFASTCADSIPNAERLVILAREFGEVCRATEVSGDRRQVLIEARKGLRGELLQVAAVAVAWVEGLDREARKE